MVKVEAAGGVLYHNKGNSCKVLLIYRNDTWDLPKGKREEGESIEECARREVAEEVGIVLPAIEHFLTDTWHDYEQNGKSYGKSTYWYKMSTDTGSDFTPQLSEGITSVQWVDVDDAMQLVGFDNLKEVLKSFRNSLL